MSHLHIDDFSQDAARILMQCYLQFPKPQAVYVEDICGPTEVDDVGLHSPRHMACLSTMLWLADEGWLRYAATIYQQGIEHAVLSSHGFNRLTAPSPVRVQTPEPTLPAALKLEKLSMAEQLLQAIREQNSSVTTFLIRYLLAQPPQALPLDGAADIGLDVD